MHTNKIIPEIRKLETAIIYQVALIKDNDLLKSKMDQYNQSDKEKFLLVWKQTSLCFLQLKKLLKKTSYRKYFFKIDYNKLVLRRYLVNMYFNFLSDVIHAFGRHESFARQYIDDNFQKNNYGNFAKYIYKVRYIDLINTPQIFLDPAVFFISEEVKPFITAPKRRERRQYLFLDSQNIYYYCKHRLENILLIISKNVGAFISRTKFSSRTHGLISKENIKKYITIAKPGDIILSRGNWNATNFTIPGFWKHMALYLGTGSEIEKIYKNSKRKNRKKYKKDTHYIIEATGKGIQIVELIEFSAHNDYLGFARTTFKKKKIETSILSALSHEGKGYDHLFNYHSDKNLVCSELVLKSYAPKFAGDEGIKFQLEKIGINFTFPPNNFIEILKREHSKKIPQVYPLFFLDSKEKTQQNFVSQRYELLESGSRPKLSFFLD